MIWQYKKPPVNIEILVKWGSKACGPEGYEIAKFDGKTWRDNRGEKIEIDGYQVWGWMLLPEF
jgi:hypothetical protein